MGKERDGDSDGAGRGAADELAGCREREKDAKHGREEGGGKVRDSGDAGGQGRSGERMGKRAGATGREDGKEGGGNAAARDGGAREASARAGRGTRAGWGLSGEARGLEEARPPLACAAGKR